MLRHGAQSSPEAHSRIALGYFTFEALLVYPPHGHDVSYVVILISETVDLLGLLKLAGMVGRIRNPG